MALTAGTRLGSYEVLSPLGAGGMGEVWKAKDTRLGREVALKVLPEKFFEDSERVARFEREARVLASLNHPNIAGVYTFEEISGRHLLVMELLEGRTLREGLRDGPLPPRRAIEYAMQIAHGLAAAHEKGIAHRDLKPENVFLTKDDRVKILDFGLAKLTRREESATGLTASPTEALLTEAGAVFGTAGYMSPEQVRGEQADHRSDIFSLGVVLHEMLSGKRPFQRDTTPETLTAILNEDPPELSDTNRNVPPALERIVRHCLEKNPEGRFQSVRDLGFDLGSLSGTPTPTAAMRAAAARPRATRRLFLLAAGAAAALALAFLAGRRTVPPPGELSFRRLTFRRGNILGARFAPDGQTVVYGASWDGRSAELFSVRTDNRESRPLGIPNADILSVSSKGELAVLLRKGLTRAGPGTLAQVPLGGGAPRDIAEWVRDADWSPNGSELAMIPFRGSGGKFRLEYPIGKVLYETTRTLRDARVSPKGDLVAVIEVERGGQESLVVADRDGKVRKLTGPWSGFGRAAWRPDGRSLVFVAGGDQGKSAIREVTLSGKERVLYSDGGTLRLHDLLPDGRLLVERKLFRSGIVMRPPGEAPEREMTWMDGSSVGALSADGSTLVFSEVGEGGGPSGSVFLRKVGAEASIRLGDGVAQSLSSDGKWVLSLVPGPPRELVLLPTGAGTARKIDLPGLTPFTGEILPDGRTLFAMASDGKQLGFWLLPLEGGKPRFLLPFDYPGSYASAPDGKRIAVRMSGKDFILPFDGGPQTPLKGLEAGDYLDQWSGDGRYLFASWGGVPGKIFRVEIETGKRELWKELMPADPAGITGVEASIAIARDGKSYAYSYDRVLASDLYLLDGVR